MDPYLSVRTSSVRPQALARSFPRQAMSFPALIWAKPLYSRMGSAARSAWRESIRSTMASSSMTE